MKKVIKELKNSTTIQITTVDERFYARPSKNLLTGLPEYQYVPSVTWIAGYYPKGLAFYKWLADKGWDESQAIKQAAGDKGSKVHNAIIDLIAGKEIKMDDKYANPTTEQLEELIVEEYEAILSFADWFKKTNPKVLDQDLTVWDDTYNYAGTIDLICDIDGLIYIIDLKTSQNIWPEYELQLSAYKHANGNPAQLAILQIGYKRNKVGWKWNEIEDKFDLFLAARKIWANENEGVAPSQKDLPLAVSLYSKEKEEKIEVKLKNKIKK